MTDKRRTISTETAGSTRHGWRSTTGFGSGSSRAGVGTIGESRVVSGGGVQPGGIPYAGIAWQS